MYSELKKWVEIVHKRNCCMTVDRDGDKKCVLSILLLFCGLKNFTLKDPLVGHFV